MSHSHVMFKTIKQIEAGLFLVVYVDIAIIDTHTCRNGNVILLSVTSKMFVSNDRTGIVCITCIHRKQRTVSLCQQV